MAKYITLSKKEETYSIEYHVKGNLPILKTKTELDNFYKKA